MLPPLPTKMLPNTHRPAKPHAPRPTREIHPMACHIVGTWTTLKTASSRMPQMTMGLGPQPTPVPGPDQSLEERLRVVEGGDRYGLEVVDLCLIPNVGLSTNFKTSEFDKYKGSFCPRVYLTMYCCKMAAYIYDNKVMIHCFQDSLTMATLSWYVSLERGRITTWRDLAEAFLKQYKYNEEMAPDRSRLQNMAKKEQEGFKEYA
ncbi:hypothetical protein CR513_34098, partial [Mucuna pruriens]